MPENFPEPRTVKDCAELQRTCRSEVFGKLDQKHTETQELINTKHGELMKELGEIKAKAAYQAGIANGRAATGAQEPIKGHRWSWREVAAAIIIISAAVASAIAAIK